MLCATTATRAAPVAARRRRQIDGRDVAAGEAVGVDPRFPDRAIAQVAVYEQHGRPFAIAHDRRLGKSGEKRHAPREGAQRRRGFAQPHREHVRHRRARAPRVDRGGDRELDAEHQRMAGRRDREPDRERDPRTRSGRQPPRREQRAAADLHGERYPQQRRELHRAASRRAASTSIQFHCRAVNGCRR
jgi:hypothetical protein